MIPSQRLEQDFTDFVVEELSVYRLQDDELFLLTRVLMPFEQLVQDVLCVDEVLPVDMLELFVVKIGKRIEVVQELIFKVRYVVRLGACESVMDQMDILVVVSVA